MGGDSGIPFGNYTLLRRIARGGMAEVFVARQKGEHGFDRLVAIKRILPHLLDDKSFVRMFQDEARLAARLSHPNVIHIYDFGKVDEHFFIAMEFMHGLHAGDLIRLAEQQPMPAALVARIGADACAGLHYAHKRRDERGQPLRLVHRDVSPPNLLVSYDGVVKIVDFGIAKAVSSIEQTRPGVVKGKYAYMSPEQTMGQTLDGRSDVFSLALVLWELLAGKPAVTRSDQVLAMKTIRDGKVPPIESVRPELPEALTHAMRGALERDPDDRSDARVFGNELEAYLKGSSEIATSMELGAWLMDRSPPDNVLGAEKTGFGTRQATMATSLAGGTAQASELLSQLGQLDVPRDKDQTRGSVVSNLPGVDVADQHATRVLVASGNVQANSGSTIRALSSADSVLVDHDLMVGGQQTKTTRLVTTDEEYVIPTNELGELGFAADGEATRVAPTPTESVADEPAFGHTTHERTTGADTLQRTGAGTLERTGPGSATLVDEENPRPPLEFVDNELTYEDHPGAISDSYPAAAFAAPAASAAPFAIPPAPAPTRSKTKWWVGLGGLIVILGILALLGGDDSKPAVAPQVTLRLSDAGIADERPPDASSKAAPEILVTSLLDASVAGVADAALPMDGSVPDVVDQPDADVEEPKDKNDKRRPRPAKKGRLAVKTSPYSVVYHQGRRLGTTPMANLPLPPGRYRLVFKNPAFKPMTKTAIIRSGKTTKLDFALEK